MPGRPLRPEAVVIVPNPGRSGVEVPLLFPADCVRPSVWLSLLPGLPVRPFIFSPFLSVLYSKLIVNVSSQDQESSYTLPQLQYETQGHILYRRRLPGRERDHL